MTDDRLRMTPGPTEVPESVRQAMGKPTPNPDLEPEFFERYRSLTDKLERVYRAGDETGGDDRDVVVLGGEGILGLEAAIASLVGPGDRVLCLSNGLYGDGFSDFVENYGGEAEISEVPWREPLDGNVVADVLDRHGEFDVATMVHCETPTGSLNELEGILDVLADHDVLSIVDAVSSLGGTPVPTGKIDVCIGASQKCLSAPPGLATCAVSDRAWERMEAVDNPSLYADLEPWRTAADEEWFPYTHLSSNLYGLDAAVDLLLEEGLEDVFARHEDAAKRCRERATELGLEPYPTDETACSPTVTALSVEGRATELQQAVLEDHDILLATGLGELEDDILRIGHMGHNARVERVERTMDAIADVLG
ncbi:pyridoxal-phosphate-dependent aminotransferase family protein [Natronococcus occultus]|uniref:Serine-pyruvate aminotransferase/archaeal aspartate aminotransferase n=1 Tax=Natronococcus occultus SP4 TaxID=694430 RepID=L0JZJ4_9EURY|nr:alanine--glyoxylate aminotransferase family protein [Natronococcus occultus]AGB37725.1 serine-pyruvate aminotransferase/archaeal aspartate aminotransferase [Natronococcus occultus SP4]